MPLGSVQQKISCVFVTRVKDEPSSKREQQMFKVIATEVLNPLASNAAIDSALATEKVDGTCCYVTSHKGLPYLWARYDRKPTKQAEKRFKKYIYSKGNTKDFVWNVDEDFKVVPDFWIPAKGVKNLNGKPYPDENGHIPGTSCGREKSSWRSGPDGDEKGKERFRDDVSCWVPVENGNKQYCWHSSTVNYTLGVALVLKPKTEDDGCLEICLQNLSDLLEQTLELIGTNINGNPYGIGNKKNPVHLLVPHGTFLIKNLATLDHSSLMSWFDQYQEGKVEGIVWHCKDGSLFKLHRHHFGLQWPLNDTHLNSKPVSIRLDFSKYEYEADSSTLLGQLSKKDTQCFDRLKDILLD